MPASSHDAGTPKASTESVEYQLVPKEDVLLALPLTFEDVPSAATVMAVPDTGADVNVISVDLASRMGLEIESINDTELRLPNGAAVQCCGIIRATVRFGKLLVSVLRKLACTIYVVPKLASPLIICRDFLDKTRTMSLHRERLVRLPRLAGLIPGMRTLGSKHEHLLCSLEGGDIEALADSGSDVDFVSLAYVQKRGFSFKHKEGWVMFADRTIGRTCGILHAQLTVGFGGETVGRDCLVHNDVDAQGHAAVVDEPTVEHVRNNDSAIDATSSATRTKNESKKTNKIRKVIRSQFHILEGMSFDVVVGIGSLESLEVYTKHTEHLVMRERQESEAPGLNRIILLGALEQKLRQIARVWLMRAKKEGMGGSQYIPSFRSYAIAHDLVEKHIPLQETLDEADQEENARQDAVKMKMKRLSGEEKAKAEAKETIRQRGYEEYRDMIVKAYEGR